MIGKWNEAQLCKAKSCVERANLYYVTNWGSLELAKWANNRRVGQLAGNYSY